MLKTVEVETYSDNPKFKFPEKCIYCNSPADEFIDFSIHQPFDLGNYTVALSDKFLLPTIGSKRMKGFEVTVRSSTTGSGHRTLHIDCKSKLKVPYCKKHVELKQEIEEGSEPSGKLLLGSLIPLFIISIYLAYTEVISILPRDSLFMIIFDYLIVVGLLGMFGGTGLAYLIHKLFGDKGPEERINYLKSSWSGSGAESLGWRCDFGSSPESPYKFLENPSIKVIHEFTNEEYAKAFAEVNSGTIK